MKFKDWVHKTTGAPTLKAQHPEFEMWNQGIHGRSGVSCADCHMPEIEYKGEKITDHQVNSPLLKVEASCTRCHGDVKPDELKQRVLTEQDRFFKQRNLAMDALMALIADLEKAQGGGRRPRSSSPRRATCSGAPVLPRLLASAENSTGFHAPQEALRILGDSIDYARQGQLVLRDAAFQPTVKIVAVPTAQPGPSQATGATPATTAPAPKPKGTSK